MHLKRQLSRLWGSLRRKETLRNNKENLEDEYNPQDVESSGKRRGRKLTFDNLSSSLRLSRRHKENSLSKCQLLKLDDEEVSCQQDNDAISFQEHLEYQVEQKTQKKDKVNPQYPTTRKTENVLMFENEENKIWSGSEEETNGRENGRMEIKVESQMTAKIEIYDQEIDGSPVSHTKTSCHNEMNKVDNFSSFPCNELIHDSSCCCESNQSPIQVSGQCTDPSKCQNEKRKKKIKFRKGVRKSTKIVRKAFQDGFVAWGHSMTYTASIMPTFYEYAPSVSPLNSSSYYYDCDDYRCYNERFNNYSLQYSNSHYSSQYSY